MNPKLLILYHPPPNHEEHRVEIPMNPLPKTIMDIRPQVHYWKSQAIKHFQLVSVHQLLTPQESFLHGVHGVLTTRVG